MSAYTTRPTHAIRSKDIVLAVVTGVLFLIASVRFGGSVAGDELDPAWSMVLGWAHLHGLHWGSDIAFTYGPLGYLYPLSAPDPAHYGRFVALQVALAAAAAFLFAHAWIAQRWPERLVLALAAAFAAPMLAADPVWLATPVLALAGLHAHAEAGRRRTLWVLVPVAAAYVAVVLLIKMSALLLVVTCWLAGGIVLLRARLRRHAAVWLALVPACSLGLWIGSGQRLGDLMPFIATVFEISRGYTAAMGQFPPLRFDLYGLGILAGCGGVGAWAAWRARRDVGRLACIALSGITLFVAWRAGFTRADTHVIIFALTAWLVLPLLPALSPAATPWLRAASLLLALAAVPIIDRAFTPDMGHARRELATASLSTLRDNTFLLLRPLTYRPALEAALQRERTRLDLPQTRAVVGTRSVDVNGTQQGVAIINGFAYRPSPVFQGYGAYTPRLQRMNAQAYSGPLRTDFVLLAYSPIDGNLPASENALAFTTLYRNYHPVLVEKSFLLLEKDETSVPPQSPPETGWQRTTWDAWVDLPTTPESVTVLAVRSELSAAGSATALLLREPGQMIELELADGTLQRQRLVRGAAPGGFLVSPPLQSLDDYVRLFIGEDLPVVRRFRLMPQDPAQRALFAPEVAWTAMQLPRRRAAALTPRLLDALFPGFSHRPRTRSAGVRTMEVDGRRVLFMHSPARLEFALEARRYVVSGEIGIVPNAYTSTGCEHGDGVEMTLGGSTGTTLAYPYNPFADASLRPARRFELGPVDVGADGMLRLDMGPGPANISDCDWAYVRDVVIRPADSASIRR